MGVALLLTLQGSLAAQLGTVRQGQKISAIAGDFGGHLDPIDRFGSAVSALGDLDGDGVGDLAVGAWFDDDGGVTQSDIGAVWILFLNPDGTVKAEQKISQTMGGFGGNLDPGDHFGGAIASLGDLDGDGNPELAVGAEADDAGGANQGGVWILFLNANGTVKAEHKISATSGGFGGDLDPGDRFGSSVAAVGDLDGDGISELAVGAPFDDGFFGANTGAVWILFLASDGTVRSEWKIDSGGSPFAADDRFGSSVAALGDLDGDGIPDLAAGSIGDFVDRGSIRILLLRSNGSVRSAQVIGESRGLFEGHLDPFDHFGTSIASLGDLDCDGIRELAVGAEQDDDGDTDQGALWILFLYPNGLVRSEQKISDTTGHFAGSHAPMAHFGHAVASMGDLNGDGLDDLAVGADGDNDGSTAKGAAWILFLAGVNKLDFETQDDFATPLVNGQDISTPPEFGSLLAISSSGPNAGAAIFDSTPGGPNDPSQDRDLLVGTGNILILQTNDSTTQTVPGIFDRPNDDEDGGTLGFVFHSPGTLQRLDLIDIDAGDDEACLVVLTDTAGNQRVYTIPPDWTGDLLLGGYGRRTLDLTSLAPQPGFGSTATALEDPGFQSGAVVSLEVHLGSSGGVDNLCWQTSLQLGGGGPRTRGQSGSGMPTAPVQGPAVVR